MTKDYNIAPEMPRIVTFCLTIVINFSKMNHKHLGVIGKRTKDIVFRYTAADKAASPVVGRRWSIHETQIIIFYLVIAVGNEPVFGQGSCESGPAGKIGGSGDFGP